MLLYAIALRKITKIQYKAYKNTGGHYNCKKEEFQQRRTGGHSWVSEIWPVCKNYEAINLYMNRVGFRGRSSAAASHMHLRKARSHLFRISYACPT